MPWEKGVVGGKGGWGEGGDWEEHYPAVGLQVDECLEDGLAAELHWSHHSRHGSPKI